MITLLNLIRPSPLRKLAIEFNHRNLMFGVCWGSIYDYGDHSRTTDLWVFLFPSLALHYTRVLTHEERVARHRARILKIVRNQHKP